VPKSVSNEVDVEATFVAIVLVEESIGEAVTEDVGMDIVWVAAAKLTGLVVPKRSDVGLVSKLFDDVSDGACCHLLGLPGGKEVGTVLPAIVEVGVERPFGPECPVDVQLEMVGAGPIIATVPGLFLDMLGKIELASIAKIHFGGELSQFLVAKTSVGEKRDDSLVTRAKIFRTSVGGSVSYRIDLVGCEPDTGLFILSFRIR